MPITTSTSGHERGSQPQPLSALDLLEHDHREVEDLFDEFQEQAGGDSKAKKAIASQICRELRKHMTIEEDIFYPAVQDAVEGAEDLVNEAIVEHQSAKKLMAEIEAMEGDEKLFDSKLEVLEEQIQHHVQEEESELFMEVESSSLDLQALGQQMAERKAQL